MHKKLAEVIPCHAYPIAAGEQFGYRCFDGKKWRDCDKNGTPKNKKNKGE